MNLTGASADRGEVAEVPPAEVVQQPDAGASLLDKKQRKRLKAEGVELFNEKPKKGIAHLQANGLLAQDAHAVAMFLKQTEGLDYAMVGDYLSDPLDACKQVRLRRPRPGRGGLLQRHLTETCTSASHSMREPHHGKRAHFSRQKMRAPRLQIMHGTRLSQQCRDPVMMDGVLGAPCGIRCCVCTSVEGPWWRQSVVLWQCSSCWTGYGPACSSQHPSLH